MDSSANKLAPASQEAETNECLHKQSKEDQYHNVKRKNQQATSRLNEDVSPTSQHCTKSIFQWPYAPPIISQFPKPSVSAAQQTSSVSLNQWHQQQNSNPDQQRPFPQSQMHQPTTPFWLPLGPSFPVIRAPPPSGYQCIVPVGTTEASLRHDPQASSLSYQTGFSPPMGFPGTWDPASWWGQAQQSHPPYTFPGPYGYFQFPPPVFPETPVTFAGSNQRGIIQPSAKLSKKHQLMWDAQSSENVQMWAAITKVQTEMTTYGSRLAKLEAEVSSIKSTLEEYSGAGAGTTAGQSTKRGRPKKVASAEVFPSIEESQPRARARKNISCKPQSENIFLHGKKERLLRDKEKTFQAAAVDGANILQQETDGKISGISTNTAELDSNAKVPLDVKTASTIQDQVNQEIQACGFSLNFTKEVNGSDCKLKNKKSELSFQTEQVTGTNSMLSSTNFKEPKGNGSHGWVSNVLPDDCGRNLLEIRSHTFYDTGSVSVIRQGGEVVPGWSFVNEGNPTEEDVGMLLRSGNDEDEDTSTGDDEMAHRGCM